MGRAARFGSPGDEGIACLDENDRGSLEGLMVEHVNVGEHQEARAVLWVLLERSTDWEFADRVRDFARQSSSE